MQRISKQAQHKITEAKLKQAVAEKEVHKQKAEVHKQKAAAADAAALAAKQKLGSAEAKADKLAAAAASAKDPWNRSKKQVSSCGNYSQYEFPPPKGDELSEVCAETTHFKNAEWQYKSLGGRHAIKKVVYIENPAVTQRYQKCKGKFKDKKDIWVFHGSNEKAIELIKSDGFKVGGVDAGVGIANGKAHGYGVYTATGTSTPETFAAKEHGSKCIILAKGLKGEKGDFRTIGQKVGDHKAFLDWVIFFTKEQLLPTYILYLQ